MAQKFLPVSPTSLSMILRRHGFKILMVFVVVMSAILYVTACSTPLFTSEARIFVRLGRESVSLDPTATTGQTVTVQESRESEINSVYELLKSRVVLESIIDKFGADVLADKPGKESEEPTDVPSIWTPLNPMGVTNLREDALWLLSKRFHVQVVRKSNVINVSCDASSPELAQQIVEHAIGFARDMHLRVNRTAGSHNFFAEQADRQAEHLATLETELRDLKNKTGVSAVASQREVHLHRISTMEDDLMKAQTALKSSQAEIAARQKSLLEVPAALVSAETTGLTQTVGAKMREQLYSLELKAIELAARYQEDNFLVQQARAQVADAKAVLDQQTEPTQTTKSLNVPHQQTQSALIDIVSKASALQAQIASLDGQLADARAALQEFNENEVKIVRIERQIELENASYRKYAENRELARIDQALESQSISNLNVLQPPSRSMTPTKPRVLFNIGVGLLLSLLGSFGIVSAMEVRQSGSGSVDEAVQHVRHESRVQLREHPQTVYAKDDNQTHAEVS